MSGGSADVGWESAMREALAEARLALPAALQPYRALLTPLLG